MFRPGHADYTYQQKYGIRDYRGGGRASARETCMRVAAGAIAKKYLKEKFGLIIRGYLSQLGPISIEHKSWDEVDNNVFFCPDASKVSELDDYICVIKHTYTNSDNESAIDYECFSDESENSSSTYSSSLFFFLFLLQIFT